jgi:hypothetical protein
MNRRAFLGALGLAPVTAVSGAAVVSAGSRYRTGGYVGEVGPEAVMRLSRKAQPLTIKIDASAVEAKMAEFKRIQDDAFRGAIQRRIDRGMTYREALRDLRKGIIST